VVIVYSGASQSDRSTTGRTSGVSLQLDQLHRPSRLAAWRAMPRSEPAAVSRSRPRCHRFTLTRLPVPSVLVPIGTVLTEASWGGPRSFGSEPLLRCPRSTCARWLAGSVQTYQVSRAQAGKCRAIAAVPYVPKSSRTAGPTIGSRCVSTGAPPVLEGQGDRQLTGSVHTYRVCRGTETLGPSSEITRLRRSRNPARAILLDLASDTDEHVRPGTRAPQNGAIQPGGASKKRAIASIARSHRSTVATSTTPPPGGWGEAREYTRKDLPSGLAREG
jgi:hypothetical protein